MSGERLIKSSCRCSGAMVRSPAMWKASAVSMRKAAQREQVRAAALTATLSVLLTALLLYPLLLAMLKQSTGLSRRLLDSNLSLMHSLGNAVAKRDSDTRYPQLPGHLLCRRPGRGDGPSGK